LRYVSGVGEGSGERCEWVSRSIPSAVEPLVDALAVSQKYFSLADWPLAAK